MRTLTKLESALMDITPTESATISAVLAGHKIHPRGWRNGAGRRYELTGMHPQDIRGKLAGTMGFRPADFSMGNDAPPGGIEGEWIKLTSSGRRKSARRLA